MLPHKEHKQEDVTSNDKLALISPSGTVEAYDLME